jgi:hypothetical protein
LPSSTISKRILPFRSRCAKGKLRLHGWVYDIESGGIIALTKGGESFISLSENPETCFE